MAEGENPILSLTNSLCCECRVELRATGLEKGICSRLSRDPAAEMRHRDGNSCLRECCYCQGPTGVMLSPREEPARFPGPLGKGAHEEWDLGGMWGG